MKEHGADFQYVSLSNIWFWSNVGNAAKFKYKFVYSSVLINTQNISIQITNSQKTPYVDFIITRVIYFNGVTFVWF